MDFGEIFNSNYVSVIILLTILAMAGYLMRRKLKAFAYVFYKSISSTEYYRDVIKADFGFSVKYFVSIVVMASVAVAFVVTAATIDEAADGFNSLMNKAETAYPEDLVIKVEGGKMNINKPQPFFVPLPELDRADGEQENLPEETVKNLIVFDSEGTLDDLDGYSTFILVNESNVLVRESNGTQVYPLRDMPDTEISRQDYDQFVGFVKPLGNYIAYFVFFTVLSGLLIYYFSIRVAALLIMGLVLLVVGRVGGMSLSYQKAFMIGAHTITLPIIVEVVTNSLGILIWLPFWFFVLHLVFSLLILFKMKDGMDGKDGSEITGAV